MKSGYTRTVAALLAATVLCTAMPAETIFADSRTKEAVFLGQTEKPVDISDFNLNKHMLNVYNDYDQECIWTIIHMRQTVFPTEVITDRLDDMDKFQARVAIWEKSNWAAASSDKGIAKDDFEAAVAISVFEKELDSSAYLENCDLQIKEETAKLIRDMQKHTSIIKIDAGKLSAGQKMAAFSNEERKRIQTYVVSQLTMGNSYDTDFKAYAQMVFDAAGGKSLADVVGLLAGYMKGAADIESKQHLLWEMGFESVCTNIKAHSVASMVSAMDECNAKRLISTTPVKLFETMMRIYYSQLCANNPYARQYIKAKSGDTSFGTLFYSTSVSNDKEVEQYEKIKSLNNYITVFREGLWKDFESAADLEMINGYYAGARMSCESALNYADSLYKQADFGWLEYSYADTLGSYKKSVSELDAYYENNAAQLFRNYLDILKVQYTDIYKLLTGTDSSGQAALQSIKFAEKEVTIGLDDPLEYRVPDITFTPANASNQKVVYESSNTAVAELHTCGEGIIPKSAGTTTITATSEDGGHKTSFTLNVVEGYSKHWSAIETKIRYIKLNENCLGTYAYDGKLMVKGKGFITEEMLWMVDNDIADDVTEIVIGEGINGIGDDTFLAFDNLEKLTIPLSVGYMEDNVFSGCNETSFGGCDKLKEITISSNAIRAIGDCQALEKITVRADRGISGIKESTFENFQNLREVILEDGITSISKNAFVENSKLEKVRIPVGIRELPDFSESRNLKEISVPASVTFFAPKSLGYVYNSARDEYEKMTNPATVYCYKESKAYSYALENNLPYKLIDDALGEEKNQPQEVVLDTTGQLLYIGKGSLTIKSTVFPVSAADKTVTWSSTDEAVATVDKNGTVTPVSVGSATIRATTVNGKTASASITVEKWIEPTKVTLSSTELTMKVGDRPVEITATLEPADAMNKVWMWSTSNAKVAQIIGGKIVPIAAGKAAISVTIGNGLTAHCMVTVTENAVTPPAETIEPSGITLNSTSLSMKAGDAPAALTATVAPANAANKTVTWSSSNERVAKVDGTGKVTPVAEGTAVIRATTGNGKFAECTVKVAAKEAAVVLATDVKINPATLSMKEGDAPKTLTATVSPANATNKTITWSSSNERIAKVDAGGKVTPVAEGSAVIRATTNNGKVAQCTVKVEKKTQAIEPTGVKLSSTMLTVKEGDSPFTLAVTVEPANATDKVVTWSSSNERVAKVNMFGVITPVGIGVATVSARTANGKSASCMITVEKRTAGSNASGIAGSRQTFQMGNSAVVVQKDASGKTTDVAVEVRQSSNVIAKGMLPLYLELAGAKEASICTTITDTAGGQDYKVTVNSQDLTAGTNLKALEIDKKKNSYKLVNAQTYTVDAADTVAVSLAGGKSYELMRTEKAATVENAVLNSIKPKKTSIAIKKGKSAKFQLKRGVDMDNVSKITYTSSKKSVASVNRSGKIQAKKTGNAKIQARVTLKNGRTKTVTMRVKVKK